MKLMGNCARCEFSALVKEVPGKVPDRPLAAVIGNYPNAEDERNVSPFSDQNGTLLRLALKNQGLDENDIIFLYALRCAPKGKSVKDIHLNACRNWVDVDLKKLRDLPEKLVLICGTEPMESLLNELDLDGGYTANRGQWIEHKGTSYLITFPPKYVADMCPFRKDAPGQWWLPPGSVGQFWFSDLAKFGKRVRELKERMS